MKYKYNNIYSILKMIFNVIIILIIFINIVLGQNISPRRKTQKYLYDNGCNNYLLNKILMSIINDKIYVPYTLLYDLVSKHTPQFEHKQIYKCFEIIMQKNIRENNYYKQKLYLLDKN